MKPKPETAWSIVRADSGDAEALAPLVAAFRATLCGFRGQQTEPDPAAGRTEILQFLNGGFPVFAAYENGSAAGYLVCRIEEPCLWVEHFFVRPESRRKGIGSALFEQAETLAKGMGEDTVYNYVHPNNEGMIRFLRAKGYTVLNLIEIRKPYPGEQLNATIPVADEVFDY